MSLGLILLIVLVLMLFGMLPTWGHSRNWGYGALPPSPFRPPKKHDALSAVRTPDETVWSLRASDIYQGGETEPFVADGAVPTAFTSLDTKFLKNYSHVVALNVCAHSISQIQP